jgi:hypothetical protein
MSIGFLAHDILILLDPKDIVENIHGAYQHPAFRESKYAVLITRPSGSADIGGKTVYPAQGRDDFDGYYVADWFRGTMPPVALRPRVTPSHFQPAKGPFVIKSKRPPLPTKPRQYYRCEQIFEQVDQCLRINGVNGSKPLHTLRKEYGSSGDAQSASGFPVNETLQRVNSQELLIERFDILENLQSVVDSVSSDGHD